MKLFPNFRQLGSMDCGPVCLRIISNFYGRDFPIDYLREKSQITKLGVSLLGISEAAETIGLRTFSSKISFEQLYQNKPFPCILHWNQNHFVVLYKLSKSYAYISDPAQGLIRYSIKDFLASWLQNNSHGVALLLEPTQQFEEVSTNLNQTTTSNWDFLFFYLKNYRKQFVKLLVGLIFSSALLLLSPFLTQVLVDKGIGEKNLNFVYLILFGQLILFLGSILAEVIRSWTLLKIGASIGISLVSDFFQKLFKLPISFFESHLLGDILQRTNDHKRLETLLTNKSLNVLFALVNMCMFGTVLFYYNTTVFLLFFSGSLLGVFWVFIFMKKRATIDFQFFELYGQQQGKVIELLNGVEEIKISNSATQARWEWQVLQEKIYKVKLKSLTTEQLQQTGFDIILRLTGILLTVITAKLVIEDQITLGAMFAINMVVGQLTNPIFALVDFIPIWQDAKLAILRINEVHNQPNEEGEGKGKVDVISTSSDILFQNVSFSYTNSKNNEILKNISFSIEAGKITAIVGASGSGKTTLLKLLLKFFSPTEGKIYLGSDSFEDLQNSKWREHCGVVMQGGKIFSDTIVNNISLGQAIDMEKIVMTCALANLDDFVNSDLPMGYFTKIGEEGMQLSEGQKQRLLLARAMYKNPDYLFLDEATSSLDSKNEREIMKSLNDFSAGKTVLIVAHRLSTVRNANKIVVLNKGEIVEIGTHSELSERRGFYFELIRNQLDLN